MFLNFTWFLFVNKKFRAILIRSYNNTLRRKAYYVRHVFSLHQFKSSGFSHFLLGMQNL